VDEIQGHVTLLRRDRLRAPRVTASRTCCASPVPRWLAGTLVPLVLIVTIHGTPTCAVANAGGPEVSRLHATSPWVSGLLHALQPPAGTMLTRARARTDATGRKADARFGALAARIPVPPFGLSVSPIRSGTALRGVASRGLVSLRGPPDTL